MRVVNLFLTVVFLIGVTNFINGEERVALVFSDFNRDLSELSEEILIDGTLVKHPFDDVSGGILGTKIKDFSYTGTPCGLVEALLKKGFKISLDRSGGIGSDSFDVWSKVEIAGFNGSLIELLVKAIPEKYNDVIWDVVEFNEVVIITFGGPIAETPQSEDFGYVYIAPATGPVNYTSRKLSATNRLEGE